MIKEEIKSEITNYIENNEKEITLKEIQWVTAKTILWEKYIAWLPKINEFIFMKVVKEKWGNQKKVIGGS